MGEQNRIISIDEGDFLNWNERFRSIKNVNCTIIVRVEKKGIDTVVRTRKFNICMFTNSEVQLDTPIR